LGDLVIRDDDGIVRKHPDARRPPSDIFDIAFLSRLELHKIADTKRLIHQEVDAGK
jgi:hypothetical protein